MRETKRYLAEAEALQAAGDWGAAIAHLEKAVALCEDDAQVTKELAKLNLRIDEVRAFQNWCHESLRIDERDPEPHEMLAAYFDAKGRLEEARQERAAAEGRRRACAGTRV